MIWALWSEDPPKEFQYLISRVLRVSSRTAGLLPLSAINSFQNNPALCTGMNAIAFREIESTFLYLCIVLLRRMYLLSSSHAAGILHESQSHNRELVNSAERLHWQPFWHFKWGRSHPRNRGSVDNHGVSMNPRKTQYF